ncbi:MAG: TolC family protein [Ignavibacteriaceae bacterium]|nr:TolC family protein [Ignavibacteriaceae bacterium]
MKRILVLYSMLAGSVLVQAQNYNALSLNECIGMAMGNANTVKIAENDKLASEQKLYEAKAQTYPELILSSMFTRVGQVSEFSIPMELGVERSLKFGTNNRVNMDLKLQLPLFTWWRVSSTIDLSEKGIELSRNQLRKEELQTINRLLTSFYEILFNKKIVELNKLQTERAKEIYDITKIRYDNGQVSELDLMRSDLKYKNILNQLSDANSNYHKSKINLAKEIGIESSAFDIEDKFGFDKINIDESNLEQAILNENTNLKALDIQMQMLPYQLSIAESGNKPNVFAFSGYNVNNGFNPMNPEKFYDNWNVGVQLSWKIFDGFATRHKSEQIQIQSGTIDYQKNEIQKTLSSQFQQFIIQLKQAENNISIAEENLKLSKKVLSISEEQYKSGIASQLDLINAEDNVSQSELFIVQSIFSHIITKINLSRITEDYSWFGIRTNEK